jgi:hypothetical protein
MIMKIGMYLRKTGFTIVLAFFLVVSGGASHAFAAIAKISQFTGEVIIQSGEELKRVAAPGVSLNDGDRVQTKQGDAEILFNDGAVMKVSPFSNAMVQEMQEQSGFWIFKTQVATRRITCIIGKLFFQSGVSGKKNYLQTPTAVAGIRGSVGDIGFDNVNSYLHMYEGEAAVVGNAIRGFFQNPGVSAAEKSAVYQALTNAYDKTRQAAATGRGVEIGQANVTAAEVGRLVAETLQKNPDPAVKANANLLAQTAEAVISSANAKVSVEQIKEDKVDADKALAEARQKGDAEKTRQAELAIQKVEQDQAAAEKAAAAAKTAAEQAAAAMAANDLGKATKAAQDGAAAAAQAKAQEQESQKAIQNVVTTTAATTVPATTVATTTATTVAPTTVPTTIMTTIMTTTTSSSSTTTITPSR